MKLRIEFRDMMLFHGHANGVDVLMPFFGHAAYIEQNSTQDSVDLCENSNGVKGPSAVVDILKDGQPVEAPIDVDRDEYLVRMEDVMGKAPGSLAPRPDVYQSPLPDDVAARITLGGPGRLEAFEAVTPDFPLVPTVMWGFPPTQHKQKLTDRVLYTLEMDSGSSYEVRVRWDDGTSHVFDVSQGHHFVIRNEDTTGKTYAGEFHVLEEFEQLYALLALPAGLHAGALPKPSAPELKELYPEKYPDANAANTPGVPVCVSGFCGAE